jgi:hypothetical protein
MRKRDSKSQKSTAITATADAQIGRLETHLPVTITESTEGIPPATTSTFVDRAETTLDVIPSMFQKFYFALGRGIAAWQMVEKNLCDVFLKVSTCRDEKIAAAMFFSPRNFSDKLNMTNNAARLLFAGSALLAEWNALRAELIDGSERRNAYAHFQPMLYLPKDQQLMIVMRFITSDGDFLNLDPVPGKEAKGLRLVLQPNTNDPNEIFKKHQKKSKDAMEIQDMVKTNRLIGNLAEKVKAFFDKIPPHEAPKK